MLRRIAALGGAFALSSGILAGQAFGTAAGSTSVMAHDLVYEGNSPLRLLYESAYCWTAGWTDPAAGLAAVRFPDGALLQQLQFWGYDADPDWLTVSLLETCQGVGFDPPVTSILGSVDSFGAIGTYFGFTPLNDHRVDNEHCGYTVRVRFNPGGACKLDALQLQKVHVGWVRDVSPAPATATYSDVPTNHAFFQYVEALAKAGVTGGCGSGKFCPDAPLTRGQMATFLARALGLEWP